MLIASIICTIYGFIKRNKFKELKWLFIYPLFSSIQTILDFLVGYVFNEIPTESRSLTHSYSINFFLAIEFFSIYLYIYLSTEADKFKKILGVLFVLYFLIILISWFVYKGLSKYPFNLIFIQAFLILLLAIIRLIDLFKNTPTINLFNTPSFWIIIGSLFYFLCTLPIYIARNFVFLADGYAIENGIYSINFICYSIFFLLIIRAYLCKPTAKQ